MSDRALRAVCLSFVIGPVAYALLAVLAYAHRGYFSIGGEIMALMLPVYVYAAACVR